MPRRYLFADESGNFDFRRARGASRFFILATVTSDCFDAGDDLLHLRRRLAWEGIGLNSEFHATEDSVDVRKHVFAVLAAADFHVDVTLLEKAKTPSELRVSEEVFYRHAWRVHLQRIAPLIATPADELFVVGASLGTRRKRNAMYAAVSEIVRGASPTPELRVAFWAANSDPCLQVADYCCWAVRRKWESGDFWAYRQIEEKIRSEVDVLKGEERLCY
jgi:hypothetical protein